MTLLAGRLLIMKIRKMKWGFYAVINEAGTEIAVASSWSEAKRLIKKLLTNRTNITK